MVDDYIPKARIKQSFNAQKLNTAEEITDFSRRYIFPEMLVRNYVDHLKHLNFMIAGKI